MILKKEKDFFVSPQKGMFKLFLGAGGKRLPEKNIVGPGSIEAGQIFTFAKLKDPAIIKGERQWRGDFSPRFAADFSGGILRYTVFHALGLPLSGGTLLILAIPTLLLMLLGAFLLKKKSLRTNTYIRANFWLSAYIFTYVYICALALLALWPDVQLAMSGADERALAFSSAVCTLCLAALLALGILQSIMLLTLTRFAVNFAWRWHFIHFFFFIAALALLPFKFMDIFATDYFSAFSMCIRYNTLWDVLIAAAGAAVCLIMISSLKRDGPFALLGISKQEAKG